MSFENLARTCEPFANRDRYNANPRLKTPSAQPPGEGGGTGQLFLQQAETVKLISPTTTRSGDGLGARATTVGGDDVETSGSVDGWSPLSVTDVEGGELLLLREISRGTHVGRTIDAVVTES